MGLQATLPLAHAQFYFGCIALNLKNASTKWPSVLLQVFSPLRLLGTNSLFMSLPVAMDSISKTRAARRTTVCGSLARVEETTSKINLRATVYLLCEWCSYRNRTNSNHIFGKTLKCSCLSSPNLYSRGNSVQGRA